MQFTTQFSLYNGHLHISINDIKQAAFFKQFAFSQAEVLTPRDWLWPHNSDNVTLVFSLGDHPTIMPGWIRGMESP